MRHLTRPVLALLLLGTSLRPVAAQACGQSTHIWIGLEAVDLLPAEHPLHALLSTPQAREAMVNGAMFPDGGYSPLTQDPYGETAHWEPFQSAYLRWIATHHQAPYTDDAALQVAFLLGMAAHGISDQIYDGVYLTRSQAHDGEDGWAQSDVDFATDVVTTSRVGAQEVVEDRVPYDTLVDVFRDFGQPTDRQVLVTGQGSLRVAVLYIGGLGQQPDQAATYAAQFPWTSEYLLDADVACGPACIQPAVAAYWLTLWDRLQGTFHLSDTPTIASWPSDGGRLESRAARSADATVSVAFARGLDQATVTPERVVVRDQHEDIVPTEARVYYGDKSNVLNVWPLADWPEDSTFTLTLSEGIASFDGDVMTTPWTTSFTTRDTKTGCGGDAGCAQGPVAAWSVPPLLLLLLSRRRVRRPSRGPR